MQLGTLRSKLLSVQLQVIRSYSVEGSATFNRIPSKTLHGIHSGSENHEDDVVVFLHGFLGSTANWVPSIKRITRAGVSSTKFLLFDMPNHGYSPRPARMTLESMRDTLKMSLDELGVKRATIVGHSMGGKVAMLFALAYPQQTAGLVSVDAAPVTYQHNHDHLLSILREMPISEYTSKHQAEEYMKTRLPDAGLRMYVLNSVVQDEKTGKLRWLLNLPVLEDFQPNMISFPSIPTSISYSGPSLFVVGGVSKRVPRTIWPLISTRFPATKFHVMEKCGHFCYAEKPEEFVRVLIDHLKVNNLAM